MSQTQQETHSSKLTIWHQHWSGAHARITCIYFTENHTLLWSRCSFHAALNYSTYMFHCVGNLPAGSRSSQWAQLKIMSWNNSPWLRTRSAALAASGKKLAVFTCDSSWPVNYTLIGHRTPVNAAAGCCFAAWRLCKIKVLFKLLIRVEAAVGLSDVVSAAMK